MRRNPLVIGLLLLLGVVASARLWVQFGYPLLLRAQENPTSTSTTTSTSGPDNVGPHAAFFDPGGNQKVATMVKSKTGKNLPITVMVSAKSGNVTGDIQGIMGSAAGLQVTVRVVDVNKNLDSGSIANLATGLNAAGLPAGTLVVFGNELNNLDKEWDPGSAPRPGAAAEVRAAGQAYAGMFAQFRSLASGYVPVPAPPDQHNANYDWNAFVEGAAGAYTGTLVANAYDLTAEGGAGVDQYLALQAKQGGQVVFFTEYGPHPNQSLQQHVDFFAANPPPVPATTLIPDKCRSQDHNSDLWLYYIDGSIYNADGQRINPADCSESGDTRGEPPEGDYYQRFIFPFYPFKTQNPQEKQAQLLAKLQRDYSVSCVRPAEYETFLGGTGSIQQMFATYGDICPPGSDNACLFQPSTALTLTSQGIGQLFGVLRDETAVKWREYDYVEQEPDANKRAFTNRFESVEQWYGANNPPADVYQNVTPEQIKETHQGPFYKLASKQMQCRAAAEVMYATSRLCTDWLASNSDETTINGCPLNQRPVRGTGMTMLQLKAEVESSSTSLGLGSGGNELYAMCDTAFGSDTDLVSGQNEQIVNSWAEKMLRVDLYMETAYRPAFLVMVTQVDNPPDDPLDGSQRVIAQDATGNPIRDTKHIIDYLVYHVPATLSDMDSQLGTAESVEQSSGDHLDIITRTIMAFTDANKTKRDYETYQQQRNTIQQQHQTILNYYAAGAPMPLDCGTTECQEPLRRALIDFINANVTLDGEGLKCDAVNDREAELGRQIGSSLEPEPDLLDKANGESSTATTGDLTIRESRDGNGQVVYTRGDPVRTKIYNVAPFGFRTTYSSEGLQALFTRVETETGSRLAFSQSDGYYRNFEVQFGENFTNNEDDRIRYYDPTGAVDENGNPIQYTITSGTKISRPEVGFTARFRDMGRVFNHSTRAVTQLIFGEGTAILNCARNVLNPSTNTEDFLRNCQTRGSNVSEGTTPDDDSYLATEVIPTDDCRSFARIGGGPTSVPFTGRQCTAADGPAGSVGKPAFVYDASYNIANWKSASDTAPCNEALYKYVVCTNGPGPTQDGMTRQGNAPALIAHEVDELGNFKQGTGKTACEYVVQEAQKAGVSPKLALAMWGEESGFSAFQVADWGVISRPNVRETKSLTQQLTGFLGTVNSHSSYLGFLLAYSGERDKSQTPPVLFCNNREFPARIKTFYDYFNRSF